MSADPQESIAQAICQELEGVGQGLEREKERESPPKALDDWKFLGLAFSGGGIRSATFNLGVLQALERRGLLKYVDYLSTVSGGGYIGSWYLSCVRQKLTDGSQRKKAIDYLRKLSRYLAPESGFFSADTWTIVMVWLRNTLLLQATLISLFAVFLLLPRFFEWGFLKLPALWAIAAAAVLFGEAVGQGVYRLGRMGEADTGGATAGSVDGQDTVQFVIVLPLLASAACFCSVLWHSKTPTTLILWASGSVAVATYFTAMFSLLHYVRYKFKWIVGLGAVGALCGGLFFGLASVLAWLYAGWQAQVRPAPGPWLAGLLGAPAILIILGLAVVLHIGLLGRAIEDSRREWWSRLGAFLAIYSIAALALGLAAVYGPMWTVMLRNWAGALVGTALSVGGVATTIGGLMAARSRDTGGDGKVSGKERLAEFAPYVFIAGLLLIVSTGVHYLLARLQTGSFQAVDQMFGQHWSLFDRSIDTEIGRLLWVMAANLVTLAILAWRVDIDEASMNPFYRNRLVRCYLGASRAALGERHPNLFTGFDFTDDYALVDLKPANGYRAPVPILNTALNLSGGDNAALEERRATSFFFTPYQSGSDLTGVLNTIELGKRKDGIRLGTCVATSGAAVSPNMGYHTSAPVAFLMTFFNVRLGLWVRNPGWKGLRIFRPGSQRSRWGLWYLLKELFATANAQDRYVYLSDGGHFENLGVYELIRRRCRYIIACDAEEDGKLVMEGLGGLVRKVRIDFNAEIDLDTSQIRKVDEKGRSSAHCAVGRIRYHNPEQEGYLVYLKSSLTGDEHSDILQYKAQNPTFPHESTGDQFFTESQFESYRCLGDHIADKAFARVADDEEGKAEKPVVQQRDDLEDLMKALVKAWKPPSPFTEGHFAHHTEELSRLWDEIRKGAPEYGLDLELFPGWSKEAKLPGYATIRNGQYLCQNILQLMENVYLDLHLETEWDHPDNEGWKALFENWAKSATLQQVYKSSGSTYGGRFRQFCEKRLSLPKLPETKLPETKALQDGVGAGH